MIIDSALQIMLILISNNDVSMVLDNSLMNSLFQLIFDFHNPLRYRCLLVFIASIQAMKCITELLMKRLIPLSAREIYSTIITTIQSLLTVFVLILSLM